MVNFGPLTAEICWRVWGTSVNFNGFRVLPALLHGTLVVGINQTLRRWTEGATYTVFPEKTSTHIIGYKLRNSCLILKIFDTKIPHIIWHHMTSLLYSCPPHLTSVSTLPCKTYRTSFVAVHYILFHTGCGLLASNLLFQQSTTVSVVFTDIHYIFFVSDDVNVTCCLQVCRQ